MSFNIEIYSNGNKARFGNLYGLDIESASEELHYYDYFSERYSEEEVEKILLSIEKNIFMGEQFLSFKITLNQLKKV